MVGSVVVIERQREGDRLIIVTQWIVRDQVHS